MTLVIYHHLVTRSAFKEILQLGNRQSRSFLANFCRSSIILCCMDASGYHLLPDAVTSFHHLLLKQD
eukprot:scaffold10190_cov294-Chaetoceros_neogracile.AAC.14